MKTKDFFLRFFLVQGFFFALFSAIVFYQSPARANTYTEYPIAIHHGKDGLHLSPVGSDLDVNIQGYAQFDSRTFVGHSQTGEDETLIRRIRPSVTVTAQDKVSVTVTPDFSENEVKLYDLYATYSPTDTVKIRAGKMKPPISLDRLQSASDLFFIERGHTGNFAPSRDLGILTTLTSHENTTTYQLGLFTGSADNEHNNGKVSTHPTVVGRVFTKPFAQDEASPWSGLGIGFGASWGHQNGNDKNPLLGSYRSIGQQKFFRYEAGVTASGENYRVLPHAYYFWDNFGVMAEYALRGQSVANGSRQATLIHQAWQIAASTVLTGEKSRYEGFEADTTFDPLQGTWGGWEASVRVGQTRLDSDSAAWAKSGSNAATQATGVGIGVNWYLNPHIKVSSSYDVTRFSGTFADAGKNRPHEKALFSRIQMSL